MNPKPDCYKCYYRDTVEGSTHSSCQHPSTKEAALDSFTDVMEVLASVGHVTPVKIDTRLNIKGSEHGIKNGWFNWPFNFDPIWLEKCDGFLDK